MPDDRQRERERFESLRESEDRALRDALVEDYLWLAQHCARRFSGRGEPAEDLEQVAMMSLVRAVDRFDPAFGVRFATFAVPTIEGELRRHFRDRTWSMRVPRRIKDLHLELKAASERLGQDLGRPPTIDELAEDLDTDPEEILEALEAGASYRTASLDAPNPSADDEAGMVLGEPDPEVTGTSTRVMVREALRSLPERDRRVVYLRFYLGMTQSEIAAEIGVSQVHVSRILAATLSRLGEELGDELGEGLGDDAGGI